MPAARSSRSALLDRIVPSAVETRTGTGHGALHVHQPPVEAWSRTPSGFVLVEQRKTFMATVDYGAGRVTHRFEAGEVGLNPPLSEVYCRIDEPQEFRIFVLPADIFSRHTEIPVRMETAEPVFRPGLQSPWMNAILAELWNEGWEGNPQGSLFAQAAEAMLALAFVRAAGLAPAIHRGGLTPRQLARATARIRASLATGVSLHTLADEAGLSLWHFCRAFKASAGVTVTEYMNRQRIAAAQSLLARGRMSVLDAATAVGFSSPSHFAKLFRRYTGHSPRDWVRSLH